MYRMSLRPRRRASSRRRNPRHKKGTYGVYRPVIHYGKKKGFKGSVFYRGPKTRFFKSKRHIRVNARRRRRSYRHNPVVATPVATNPRRRRSVRHSYRSHRRTRRNPKFKLPMGMDKTVIAAAKVAGGIAAGFVGLMITAKLSRFVIKEGDPKTATVARFIGVGNVIMGAVAAAMIKNKAVKDAALIVTAVGIYDLISKNIPIGLPIIVAEPDKLLSFLKGDEEPGVIGSSYQETGADYAPAFGSSYQETGDDISYGGDTFELD